MAFDIIKKRLFSNYVTKSEFASFADFSIVECFLDL